MNNQTFKIVYSEPWFWKCSISKAIKPVIYTQYNDRRIVKRYENTNIVKDAYTEVFEEINNILNEQIHISSPPPPLRRQPAMDHRLTPQLLKRQYPINAPNLELV
jgi:hypothetical protein